MTENYQQGPVSSLRADDNIVIRQSNGRDMYLPVAVLVAHVADTIKKARIPVEQIDNLSTQVANAISGALDTFQIPAERVTGLASVATTGQIAAASVQGLALVATTGLADDVQGLALVAKTGKYSDLHGKPGDPPGPP